jgi:hypothetical protein
MPDYNHATKYLAITIPYRDVFIYGVVLCAAQCNTCRKAALVIYRNPLRKIVAAPSAATARPMPKLSRDAKRLGLNAELAPVWFYRLSCLR